MITADFFASRKLVYPFRNFVSPQETRDLLTEMQNSPAKEAVVLERSYEQDVFPLASKEKTDFRKTREIWVSHNCRDFMYDKLIALLPKLNAFYGRQANMLNRMEMVQFLKYVPGDFFRPHQDWNPHVAVENLAPRLISFTLFLNLPVEQAPENYDFPTYKGGELEFFIPHANLPGKVGLAIKPEAGMLTTFLPQLVHGVKKITAGERYTIVGWFQ